MNLGIICFLNNSGLGNQTRRLCEMLRPYRILAIDSSGFSKNAKQYPERFDGFQGYITKGFPSNKEIRVFLKELTHVICCENPLNFFLLDECKRLGIKVYIQSNYEFCDHLDKDLTLPTKFLMPSYWMVEEMKAKFGDALVEHLPPPINVQEFAKARDINFIRAGTQKNFLHIIGTLAHADRNGTIDLLAALSYTKENFTLTIRSQHELPAHYMVNDRRVRYIIEDAQDVQSMYSGYDALILPRRYGGLSLTCNEALMSGLPVIMPNISPNNKLLPSEWLVSAKIRSSFMTRTMIDVYASNVMELAEKIDWLVHDDCEKTKTQAFEIGYKNFSDTMLRKKYEKLLV